MKKKFSLILLIIFLASCTKNDLTNLVEKNDFYIQVETFGNFSNTTYLEKTGRLNSSQDIILKSQVNGQVKSIKVKEGYNTKKGEILAIIDDNISNYRLSLKNAQNLLDRAKINYDSTKINLDKAVFDSELNLEKLNKNLQALKDNTKENIRIAQTDLDSSDYTNIDSSSALQLQKLDNTIEKLQLDYQNLLSKDQQNLFSIYNGIKKEYSNSSIFLNDIINFSDEILGLTDQNKDKNDSFENYLGAKNTGQKSQTENNLRDLINFKNNTFNNFDTSLVETQSGVLNGLDIINKSYKNSSILLENLEKTLNNSIESIGALSSIDISNYISKINGYQANMQANYGMFLSFDTNARSFLNTYLSIQDSTLKSIELTKKDREILKKSLYNSGDSAEAIYNKTLISSNDSIDSLKIQITSAINNIENAKKTREVTLRSLDNAIKNAQIAYEQALTIYNKLTIISPIDGIVSKIHIDNGQDINQQTSLFSIKSNLNKEINISFNKQELEYIENGKEVIVEFDNFYGTGNIYSISGVADENLKYNAIINLLNYDFIGDIVGVKIPIKTKNILLPLDIIKINSNGIGTINIFKDNQIEQLELKLGEIYGNKIEILDEIDLNTQIITSYIDNFDEDKYILKVK